MLRTYLLLLTTAIAFCCCSEKADKSPVLAAKEEKVVQVGIQPFKGFNETYTDTVCAQIESAYGFETIKFSPIEMPKRFFVNTKSPRYRADSLTRFLYAEKPDSIDIMLGLTHHDISTTKRDKKGQIKEPKEKYTDWGIFGLGMIGRGACVVSSFRLGRNAGEAKKINRLHKVALHEVGHTLGLPHCPDEDCFMRDAAESIKTIDFVGMELCEDCGRKIGNGNQ